MSSKEITFNSKSKNKYRYLSSFYGDVEICFMQKRFSNSKMKKLFDKFKTCDSQTFKKLLQLLQPDKSGTWTEKKLNYWFDTQNEFAEPKPIRGILAKLLGNVIKNPTSSKNIKVIEKLSEKLKISKEDVIKPGKITDDNDMMECLEQKFSLPEYKSLLLETNNSILHEKPLQGKGNDWTFPGKDKLGIMLMQIRNKFKNELNENSDISDTKSNNTTSQSNSSQQEESEQEEKNENEEDLEEPEEEEPEEEPEDKDKDEGEEDSDSDRDSSSETDFDYDDEYFQKFDAKLRNNIITDYHPEAINHNYDEVKKLTSIVRDDNGIIIDPLHKTLPILTKYEKTRVLGQRATQLDIGGKSLINVPDNIINSYLIAEEELKQKKLPFIIKRPIPNGGFEYWDVNDLEQL